MRFWNLLKMKIAISDWQLLVNCAHVKSKKILKSSGIEFLN